MNQFDLTLDDLRKRVDGLVIEPGSFEYAALPKLNNARFDHIQEVADGRILECDEGHHED